jgi:dipeptide/tripeptide permease
MGYTSTIAQLFTVPPNITGFITVIITAYFSDKVRFRGPFIVAGTIIGICGYIMLLASDQNSVKYGGTFLIGIGVFQCSPMLMVGSSFSTAQQTLESMLTSRLGMGSE